MFSQPWLQPGEHFPASPTSRPGWNELMHDLAVPSDGGTDQDPLLTCTQHAIGWVESPQPEHNVSVFDSHLLPKLEQAGLVRAIAPKDATPDYALVDGGHFDRYGIRLAHLKKYEALGKLCIPTTVVYAGQRLRTPELDGLAKLRTVAMELQGQVDDWASAWLTQQLACDNTHANRWHWSFPSEWHLAILGGLYHNSKLCHTGSRMRPNATSIDPSIPIPHVAADDFISEGGQRVTILNARARIREHAGRRLPLREARPTGRSCFAEWLALDNPPEGSSVLFVSHQPNIYRSWFDIILHAAQAGRQDLRITATGAALEPNATVGDVLKGLGNLIIAFYSLKYEGGLIDQKQPPKPFNIDNASS